jgi:hypothetical protein
LDPDFVDLDVANSYFMLGQLEDAHRAYVAFDQRLGDLGEPNWKARERGWADGGWEGALRAVLDVWSERESFSPWVFASTYCMIGEIDEAFTWLERAYQERDPLLLALKAAPYLDPLRSDPRYEELVRRIGFPED